MTKEEAQALYDGKFFYVVAGQYDELGEPYKKVFGPYDNIYYVNSVKNGLGEPAESEYAFLQVIDGKPVQAFKKEEVLVLTYKL